MGGKTSTGTVSVAAAAPYDLTFDLSDNTSAVTLPATAVISAAATSADFPITTASVSAVVTRQITAARKGLAKTVNITLNPGGLGTVTVTPNNVIGGQTATGKANLTGPAPAGGIVVNLSDNSSALSTPPTVSIAAGTMSGSFTVGTSAVNAVAVRQVSANLDAVTRTANITLNPGYVLVEFTLIPSTVKGGNQVAGQYTLNKAAPAGGLTLTVTDNSGSIDTPTSVFVPAGGVVGQFPIETLPVNQVAVRTVSVTYNATITRSLTLTP